MPAVPSRLRLPAALLVLAALALPARANEDVLRNAATPGNWALQLGNYSGQRFSALSRINRANVGQLSVAWSFSIGPLHGHDGGVIVIDDTMYLHAPSRGTVYALDLTQGGRMKWQYAARPAGDAGCCDPASRGLAVADGKLFLTQTDGALVALDAVSGQMIWSAVGSEGDVASTAAPLVVKDKVIIGTAGGGGWLTAYDINTGRGVWRVPAGPEDPGPAGAWGWSTYDPALNLLYHAAGGPGGAGTIVARDADTGQARWLFRKPPAGPGVMDGRDEGILAEFEIKGGPHKVLVNFDRAGVAYTLDRSDGTLLAGETYDPAAPGLCAAAGLAQGGGARGGQPAAYSPQTQLFFLPNNHLCLDYQSIALAPAPGRPPVGATLLMYPAPAGHGDIGSFIAWDAAAGRVRWSVPEPLAVWTGALATAGGLVFYGTPAGDVVALDQETGHELWRQRTPSGVVGNINTFQSGGRQYLAVLSGLGGWAGMGLAATEGAAVPRLAGLDGVLTVFELPEAAAAD